MYATRNFKTKKALKDAVQFWNDYQANGVIPAGCNAPRAVEYFQPGPFGGREPRDGEFSVEGPHFPESHRWYARVIAKDGVIVKVK